MNDSQPTRKTKFVSINLTTEARDELRRVTLEITTPVGRRVSMSDVLLAALRTTDRDELVNVLREEAR